MHEVDPSQMSYLVLREFGLLAATYKGKKVGSFEHFSHADTTIKIWTRHLQHGNGKSRISVCYE